MSSYYYRGKRYTKRQAPVKRALKRLASRVWEVCQGVHPPGGGGRDPDYYVRQQQIEAAREAERQAQQEREEEIANDPETRLMY